ncbi:adat1, partial [Symbiodinium pilosum]
MTAGGGQVLHDCHAEALCRRAFHRFLLADMICAACGTPSSASLLRRVKSEELLFALQDDLHLHFYVSTLPCGQCAMLPLSNNSEGSLARKPRQDADPATVADRNRTGAKPSRGMPTDPKAVGANFHQDGVLRYKSGRSDTRLLGSTATTESLTIPRSLLRPESRTVCYSCSDKICRWNHVGWQGALLSRLLQAPVYMKSIVIGGSLFQEGFVKNALFGRALLHSASNPGPLFCNTRLSFQSSREAAEATEGCCKVSTAGLSLVWAAADLPSMGAAARLHKRSISNKTPGFYDILIGHTGQRQGLRNDQGRRKDQQAAHHSWAWRLRHCHHLRCVVKSKFKHPVRFEVSPLCKKLMVEDALQSIWCILGSGEALADWLASDSPKEGVAEHDGDRLGRKRRRLSSAPKTSVEADAAPVRFPTYAWFKEAASCPAYQSSRSSFHSVEPFMHWARKHKLASMNNTPGVDAFEVQSALDPSQLADSELFLAHWPVAAKSDVDCCMPDPS